MRVHVGVRGSSSLFLLFLLFPVRRLHLDAVPSAARRRSETGKVWASRYVPVFAGPIAFLSLLVLLGSLTLQYLPYSAYMPHLPYFL